MKTFVVITFLFFNFINNSQSQVSTQWSSVYNGSASDTDIVNSMTVDAKGNIYVTGYSNSGGSFTGKDIAVVKYNSSGQQVWVAKYNNSDADKDDISTSIVTDASGNIFVTGYSSGLKSFKDILSLKFSSAGKLIWSVIFNGKGNDDDVSSAIATDAKGNIYITGYSVGSESSEDIITIKYDTDGIEQWVNIYDNPDLSDIDIGVSLSLSNKGNIYVAGYSIGKASSEDYVVIKYDLNGDELWVSRYNGEGNDYDIAAGISIDNSDNVYITGYSLGIGTSDDFATVKYDTDGNEIWVNRFNGKSNEYDIATSIATDNLGNVFVTGYSFDNLTSENYTTIKYDQDGLEEWVSLYDGEAEDVDIASAVKVDNKGGVYVSGYSTSINDNENYATLKYNYEGNEQWIEIFNGSQSGSDIATALALDKSSNIYVSGYSFNGSDNIDFATVKYSQTTGISYLSESFPTEFSLKQNYPNPFNPTTKINFSIPKKGNVSIKIYDVLGKEVITLLNEKKNAGNYEVEFNAGSVGGGLSSGVYFYRIESGEFREIKRMVLIK